MTGDPAAGRAAMAERHCGACHEIPGVVAAHGTVGPPLGRFSRRTYVAGRLPNTEDNVRLFIRVPQQVDAEGAMPNLGIGEEQARDMAAYLGTLR